MVYSPLAYGAAWIEFTYIYTGQCNKAPLVPMPHHCAAPKRNPSCCSLLYSDTILTTDMETGLVEKNLKKPNKEPFIW